MNSKFKTAAVTGKNDSGKRADRIIRKVFPEVSLSVIYREIRNGRIRINGEKIKPDCRVCEGDSIDIHISLSEKTCSELSDNNIYDFSDFDNQYSSLKKEKNSNTIHESSAELKNAVIFENENIIAVNKKRGTAVHSGGFSSKKTATLEESVRLYLKDKTSFSLTFSPGPLHRLDRNTSGLILFGKSIEGARVFSEMLRNGKTEKCYIALFDGKIESTVKWENSIYQDRKLKKSVSPDSGLQNTDAKKAVTIVNPVITGSSHTLALVTIPTGRYHQIRKQGEINSHPLTGDKKYGGSSSIPFYLLHSYRIVLREYSDITGFKTITAPLPDYFIKYAGKLFSRNEISQFMDYIDKY